MRVTFIFLWLLLSSGLQAATPEVGKEALRKLAKMPGVAFPPSWTFDPEKGFVLGSATEDIATEITDLQKQVKPGSIDAGQYQRLGELFSALRDNANAQKVFARAAELYRRRVDSQADDAALLVNFSKALQGSGKMEEAESALRQALRIAPKDWKTIVALGNYLDAAARNDVNSSDASGLPGASQVARARRELDEADDCFDRAVAAAPDEAEVYLQRGRHRSWREIPLKRIRAASGAAEEDGLKANNQFSPEALKDLQEASRLSPKDYALIGSVVIFEIYTFCSTKGEMHWADFSWSSLPDKSQRSIHLALTRLENLGQGGDATSAAGALETLGILEGPTLHETQRCIAHLRHAVALDPSRDQAWEVLTAALAESRRYHELLSACEDRVKQKESARSHLLLAKSLEKEKRTDKAESEIRKVLKLSPNDLAANLSLAALMLRRSQNSGVLSQADGWLSHAEQLLNEIPAPQRNRQLVIDLTLTRSIYFALMDDLDSARHWAQAVLNHDPDNQAARAILSAMNY